MYAPRVFVSMVGALAIFAIATYCLNGSLVDTLIDTAISAVLLQIGYFGGVLFLVWKESRARETRGTAMPSSARDDKETLVVTPFKNSEPFNR
jgi:exopolysaccharide production repressor protein